MCSSDLQAVEAFAAAIGGPEERLARADLDVTAALVDAARSPVFALCLNPVAAALESMPTLRRALYRDPASNLAGWQMLVAWLRDPRPEAIDVILAMSAARDLETVRAVAP